MIIIVENQSDEDYIKLLLKKTGLIKEFNKYNILFEYSYGNKIIDPGVIHAITGTKIPLILIRDRDENNDETISKLEQKSNNRIHFWSRREIENYGLSFNSLYKTLYDNEKLPLKNEDNENALRKTLGESVDKLLNKIVIMIMFSRYKKLYITENQDKLHKFIREKNTEDRYRNL